MMKMLPTEAMAERAGFSTQRLERARRLARSTWGMSALICIMVIGVVAVSLVDDYQAQVRLTQSHLDALAEGTQRSLNHHLETIDATLQAASDRLLRLNSTALQSDLEAWQQRLPDCAGLVVLNPLGRIIAATAEAKDGLSSDQSRAPWRILPHNGTDNDLPQSLSFRAPFLLSGQLTLPVSRAVYNNQGQVIASVTIFLSAEKLAKALETSPERGMIVTARLHADGKLVSQFPPDPALIGKDISQSLLPLQDNLRGMGEVIGASPMDRRLIASRMIDIETRLYVDVSVPKTVVYNNFTRQLLLWSVLCIMLVLLAILATRNHVQQLLRLYLQSSVIERQNVDLRSAHTELMRENEERRQAEQQRDSFFNLSADLLTILDSDARIIRLNPAFADTLGEQEISLRGVDVTSFFQADDVQTFRKALEAALEDGDNHPAEVRCQTIEGQRWLLWTLVARQGLIFAIAHDFTTHHMAAEALRQAKDVAERANATKTQFLANMSHELRTPLNAIIGFSETLSLGLYGDLTPKQAEYINDIHKAGQHLLGIVTDLLDMSVVDSGAMVLKPRLCPLQEIVDEALSLIRTKVDEGGITLLNNYHLQPLPSVFVDCGKIRQVLVNLLSNAVKFTPRGGRITLEVAMGQLTDGLSLSVIDTGIGIATEDIPQVLSPFGRNKAAYASAYGGIGLGLPLAQRLAEMHQGTLTINSTLGQGTTVCLWIPPERLIDPQTGELFDEHFSQST